MYDVELKLRRHGRIFRRWRWNIYATGAMANPWNIAWTRRGALREAVAFSEALNNIAQARRALTVEA